jgi:HEPN domain-containing protein
LVRKEIGYKYNCNNSFGDGLVDNLEEGLRWLDQAEADLKTARDCLKDKNYYASAFFSQQSAEKALKSFLYSKGYRALITHSVTELLEEASKIEKVFGELINYGKELDRHYIGARYPNFYPRGPAYKYYSEEIAEKCLNYAELILREVKRFIRR